MKISISSDEYMPILDVLLHALKERGHEAVYFGPLKDEKPQDWPKVTLQAISEIKEGRVEEAIVLCWTGTGCTLIANKIPGVRAALCADAETAKGARVWNHANVLALSLRTLTETTLKEILTAWFETPFSTDEWNLLQMQRILDAECLYSLDPKS